MDKRLERAFTIAGYALALVFLLQAISIVQILPLGLALTAVGIPTSIAGLAVAVALLFVAIFLSALVFTSRAGPSLKRAFADSLGAGIVLFTSIWAGMITFVLLAALNVVPAEHFEIPYLNIVLSWFLLVKTTLFVVDTRTHEGDSGAERGQNTASVISSSRLRR